MAQEGQLLGSRVTPHLRARCVLRVFVIAIAIVLAEQLAFRRFSKANGRNRRKYDLLSIFRHI
jgi:hypothetical protein